MSIDKAIKNAVASVKMEGYQIDTECVQWCKKLLENEINMEQYIALIKQRSEVISKRVTVSIHLQICLCQCLL